MDVKDRVQHLNECLTHDAIRDSGDPEGAGLLWIGAFRNMDPLDGLPDVPILHQLALDLSQVHIPVRIEHAEGHPIKAVRAFVGSDALVSPLQVVPAVHLIDERVGFSGFGISSFLVGAPLPVCRCVARGPIGSCRIRRGGASVRRLFTTKPQPTLDPVASPGRGGAGCRVTRRALR